MTIIMLAATFGTVVDIEAPGDDEEEAVASVAAVFDDVETDGPDDAG